MFAIYHRCSMYGPVLSFAASNDSANCRLYAFGLRPHRISDCLVRDTACYVALAPWASGVAGFAVTAGTIL